MLRQSTSSLVALAVAAAFASAPVAAQTTPYDKPGQPAPREVSQPPMQLHQSDQAAESIKAYTVEKKQEAVDAGRKLVRAAEQDIKDLEKSAAKAGGQAKAEFKKEVKVLEAQRAAASKKLNEMGKASAAAWDGAKQGFVVAYRDLHESLEKAAAKFKS